MNRFGQAVRSIDAAASTNGASRLISTADRICRPGLSVTVLITPAKSPSRASSRHQPRPLENQAVEVVGETLAEPQLVARRRPLRNRTARSPLARSRSMFQAWKNSCETVPRMLCALVGIAERAAP